MFQLNEIIDKSPFSLKAKDKYELYNKALSLLNDYHYDKCSEYKNILDILNYKKKNIQSFDQFPFLPVQLFKQYDLLSVNSNKIFKVMNSSGTTGKRVSKIFLDKENANFQRKVLTKILSTIIGNKRLPMLIIDTKSIIKDRENFSARGAGIIGFSTFGKGITYALDENLKLDINGVKEFAERYQNDQILLFGFTSIIYKYFLKSILDRGIILPRLNGTIIHGGGWKKLKELKIDNALFKKNVFDACGISNVVNYYGMIEQTGSIFIECVEGYLHTSIFSDIIIRRNDFSVCDFNESGLVQLISLLPTSYPGHNIISEDIGEIKGVDDCKCGKFGKYFLIHGRAQKAEVRGCSDTIE